MIASIYAIRDKLTGYLTPTFDANDQVAMRNFAHAVQNTDTLLHTHAADYDLYCLGTFDTETGTIMPINPQVVCTGSSFSLKGGSNGD